MLESVKAALPRIAITYLLSLLQQTSAHRWSLACSWVSFFTCRDFQSSRARSVVEEVFGLYVSATLVPSGANCGLRSEMSAVCVRLIGIPPALGTANKS